MIGVIGGMGPAATADFYARLVEATPARRDQDHLHVVIDGNPAIPDRSAALLRRGPDPTPLLVDAARRLESMGAELLVMPCNTASAFSDAVSRAVRCPLLRWHEVAVAELRARVPQARSVGLLATEGTVAAGVYQRALAHGGLACVVPRAALQAQVARIIARRKAGDASEPLRTELGAVVSGVAADVVLLACTELSSLRLERVSGVLDASQLVAEHVVRRTHQGSPRAAGT